MNTINFKGNKYPIKIIDFPFGERKISTINLNHNLMNEDGSYYSEEARFIDEQIFYFVEEKVLYGDRIKIAKLILSEI